MKFKNFKKTISLILTLATVLSASLAISNLSAKAFTTSDYNYDFESDNANLVKGSDVEIIEAAENGDEGTTFTGKAAYLPPRRDTATSNITYKMRITSAGKYRLSFDLDVFGGNSPYSTGNMLVGLYDGTPGSYNRGYVNNENTARLVAYDKNTNSEATNVVYDDETGRRRGTTVKLKANDVYNYKFISEFEIAEAKDIFIGICFYFNSKDGSNTDHAYLDNIKLTETDGEELLTNGNFEYGSLYGYDYSYNGDDKITVKDNSAFIPTRTTSPRGKFLNQKVKLGAGDYVFKFDADITYTGDETVLFSVAKELDDYGRAYSGTHVITEMSGDCINGNYTLNNYSANNGVGTGAFAIKGSADENKKGTWAVYFSLDSEQEIYVSIGIMGATNPENSNATAYITNLSLKKDIQGSKVKTYAATSNQIYLNSTMRNHFVPYGSAIDNKGNVLVKANGGYFIKQTGSTVTMSYFKKPSADGITTFGASFKADEDITKNGIQFGSYTESVNDKEFYTLVIRGSDEAAVNALTTEQKTELVNKYLDWNKELADKWGKCTVGGTAYVIKVVKQKNYMWKDADTDNTKLQYAVRLYGNYSGDNGNVVFSAIGFSKSGDTVSFADSFKTASYNGLAG